MDIPLPHIELFFDGSTKDSNPGLGGAAAILIAKWINWDDDDTMTEQVISSVSNRMGVTGNNCAEYYGLILGLRELLHCYPDSAVDLSILGDSEIVIKQLKGEYQVRDEVLKNYYLVTKGLLSEIARKAHGRESGSVKFIHIPRDQNQRADALAKLAAGKSVIPNLRYWHYPCLGSFYDGHITGGIIEDFPVKVAHDFGAAAFTPEVYIDAETLRSVYGDQALMSVKSTGRKNLIAGRSEMTILGSCSIEITFGHGTIKIDDALVVDFLPWPLQISGDHPACKEEKIFGHGHDFVVRKGGNWRSQVPPRHQRHPYWTSNKLVVAG